MGSPALGVEAGIRKAPLCAAETGELCKASPGAGWGGGLQIAFRAFLSSRVALATVRVRMKQSLLLALLAGILAGTPAMGAVLKDKAAPVATAKDSAKTQQLVKKQCGGCHGDDGNSLKPNVPKLAGQYADYLYKQLRNFKAADGKPMGPANPMYPTPSDLVYIAAPEGKLPERTNPLYFLAMNGMVKDLTDDQMKAIALYFSEQQRKPAEAVNKSGEVFAAAQKLYRAGDPARGLPTCAGCHGPTGAGLPAQFPRLSGQVAPYTIAQLKNFRAGYRTNDPNNMMRDIAYKLTEDEIAGLADYIAGLR